MNIAANNTLNLGDFLGLGWLGLTRGGLLILCYIFLIGARTLLGAPGLTSSSKDATRNKGHVFLHCCGSEMRPIPCHRPTMSAQFERSDARRLLGRFQLYDFKEKGQPSLLGWEAIATRVGGHR